MASSSALKKSLEQSVQRAKEYITDALNAMLDLGKGSGPLNHAFELKGKYIIKKETFMFLFFILLDIIHKRSDKNEFIYYIK